MPADADTPEVIPGPWVFGEAPTPAPDAEHAWLYHDDAWHLAPEGFALNLQIGLKVSCTLGYMDNPPACGAPKGWRFGYLPCGCRNDGYGRHIR